MVATTNAIANYGDLCGENPLWSHELQALFWIDALGQRLCAYRWSSGQTQILKQDVEVNGFTLNEDGNFILANNRGVWSWDGRNEAELILDQIDGIQCQLNDCIADPAGH